MVVRVLGDCTPTLLPHPPGPSPLGDRRGGNRPSWERLPHLLIPSPNTLTLASRETPTPGPPHVRYTTGRGKRHGRPGPVHCGNAARSWRQCVPPLTRPALPPPRSR